MAVRSREALLKEIENGRLLTERASEGDIKGVRELLTNGVHPNADAYNRTLYYKSKNYWTPLHHAVRKGYHEIVQLLVDNGGMFLECELDSRELSVVIVELQSTPHVVLSEAQLSPCGRWPGRCVA